MEIDDDSDVDAPFFRSDQLLRQILVSQGKEGDSEGAPGGSELFLEIGKGVSLWVWKEPDFHLLSADKTSQVAVRSGRFFLQEAGDFMAGEANDEIVVHPQRGGCEIGGAEEDLFFVEDENFLMHEPRLENRVDLCFGEGFSDVARAGRIVVEGRRDFGLDFFGKGFQDRWIGEAEHGEVDRMIGASDRAQESEA